MSIFRFLDGPLLEASLETSQWADSVCVQHITSTERIYDKKYERNRNAIFHHVENANRNIDCKVVEISRNISYLEWNFFRRIIVFMLDGRSRNGV